MIVRVLAAGLLALLLRAGAPAPGGFPVVPPSQQARTGDSVVRLNVEYDDDFAAQHGDDAERFIREAVAIHSIEWLRYRRERFEIESVRQVASSRVKDGAWVLASFLNRTISEPGRLHVKIAGRPLEVYSGGSATGIGGLAFRGSDAVLISAVPGASAELMAYYLFHEIGHCYDAYDLPFRGGESTFGAKSRITFEIDAGNSVIIDESPGPRTRDTPGRAPAILRQKMAHARGLRLDGPLFARLHDLLLHEPSRANPAYVAKKRQLLRAAGPADAKRISELLSRYELTPQHARRDDEIRTTIAEHYWNANNALRRSDYATAEAELAAIRSIDADSRDVHLLVGAVERKIRRRR